MFDALPSKPLRALAFYLPQFHPVPENDAFWGTGFSEWRNVVQARPRYRGHEQPHLPADLGFYDLRLAETRAAQAEMARAAGLHGFCYYHYWFGGRRLLNRPFDEVLASREPDFPFMLAWANENWTRAWDGGPREVLLSQTYSDADTRAHARHLIPIFSDSRYIQVGCRPVFAVYNAEDLPCPQSWTDVLRKTLQQDAGLEPYLVRVERYLDQDRRPPRELGFDAALEFQPFSRSFRKWLEMRPDLKRDPWRRTLNRLTRELQRTRPWRKFDATYDLSAFAEFDARQPPPDYTCFPGVCPSWDNSARRPQGASIIFRGSSPKMFEKWATSKIRCFQPPSSEENLIFINAWNEWAEGCHLEPCLRHGHHWLESIRRSLAPSLDETTELH